MKFVSRVRRDSWPRLLDKDTSNSKNSQVLCVCLSKLIYSYALYLVCEDKKPHVGCAVATVDILCPLNEKQEVLALLIALIKS